MQCTFTFEEFDIWLVYIFSSGNVADLISSTDGKEDLVNVFIAEEERQVHKHSLLERNDTTGIYYSLLKKSDFADIHSL